MGSFRRKWTVPPLLSCLFRVDGANTGSGDNGEVTSTFGADELLSPVSQLEILEIRRR